jgi:hypothetical protein
MEHSFILKNATFGSRTPLCTALVHINGYIFLTNSKIIDQGGAQTPEHLLQKILLQNL